MMRSIAFLILICYTACTTSEKNPVAVSKKSATTIIETNDANAAALDTSYSIPLPVVKKIKSPDGIYQVTLGNTKTQQTIAFNSDLTFLLQEKYANEEKDSIVTTKGTWMPSDGFIWLYKEQVARGKYKWKGDTLQYYSPLLKKSFSMHHAKDAVQNVAWKNKSKEGIVLLGLGNEPFWNVELNNKDSLSFLVADWDKPLKLKVDSSFNNTDSISYFAKNDSTQIRVTIFPHFCSDGMSDYVYRNKVKVHFNQKTYNGCAILYK